MDAGSSAGSNPAAQLDGTFVEKATKALGNSLFSPTELILVVGHPVHFTIGDDTGGDGFEKEFAEGHLPQVESLQGG